MEINLIIIIGANVIALSYVIRKKDSPDLTTQPSWEVKTNLGSPHNGTDYVQYKLRIHNTVFKKRSDVPNSFTYVKSHILKDDGQVNIKALCN